jgi:hypothetical protein
MSAATVVGHVEDGVVRLNAPAQWKDGQVVLVIPLDALPASDETPPADLLEQDAAELAPRRDVLRSVSEDDLR